MIEINIHKTLGKFHLNMEVKSDSKRIGILGASGCGKSMAGSNVLPGSSRRIMERLCWKEIRSMTESIRSM